MNIQSIRDYYRYADWANSRVVDRAATLTSTQFLISDLDGVWPIRETLVHVMWAQELWLDRWLGTMRSDRWQPERFPDVASVAAVWQRVNEETWQFIDQLTENQLAAELIWTNQRGEPFARPLWQLMLHQCNHATYHRGDVAAMPTRFGASPGEIDFLRFFEAREADRT